MLKRITTSFLYLCTNVCVQGRYASSDLITHLQRLILQLVQLSVSVYNQTDIPDELERIASVSISCDYYLTVGLTVDGTVVCWGDDEDGQCQLPPEHQTAVAVSCGGYQTRLKVILK
jgi:alpha-tubulin suppressor-like RCC1 family protein